LPLSRSDLTDTNPLKKSLLAAARLTKLILQEESEFTSSLAGHTWTVSRTDLNKKVIIPYLDNLRQKINDLLEKQQKSSPDITDWLSWFLDCLGRSITGAERTLDKVRKLESLGQKLNVANS
jgi:hypothetical protein